MKWEQINQLCDVVRETSFAIHAYHRNGHLDPLFVPSRVFCGYP